MKQIKTVDILKIIISLEVVLVLALSSIHLSEGVLFPGKSEKNEIGKYKDILIPVFSNTNGYRFGRDENQVPYESKIIRYDLYLLNTETGEINRIEKP